MNLFRFLRLGGALFCVTLVCSFLFSCETWVADSVAGEWVSVRSDFGKVSDEILLSSEGENRTFSWLRIEDDTVSVWERKGNWTPSYVKNASGSASSGFTLNFSEGELEKNEEFRFYRSGGFLVLENSDSIIYFLRKPDTELSSARLKSMIRKLEGHWNLILDEDLKSSVTIIFKENNDGTRVFTWEKKEGEESIWLKSGVWEVKYVQNGSEITPMVEISFSVPDTEIVRNQLFAYSLYEDEVSKLKKLDLVDGSGRDIYTALTVEE